MNDCPGSGRELPTDPPPAEAATCPVCGRETRVEPRHTGDELTFTVAAHQQVNA
ncbi:hypothetical protein [Mycolicibacterium sp.]|uniref:hypothetical protein n=1 Tax=Mycolicibacterium sp. TaxID=2320850 RepID=UPI003D125258